ncbi:MAG: hypothetical protein KKH83_01580, partial [Candidatus Margulisbacteria bacterium]|nr:hypothetical protein [Candidatus Margulisiibacteriota bacterium]
IAVIASFILLFTIYFIVTPKSGSLESGENIEKIVEFKDTYVAGHEEGRKSWRFYAEYGWSGKNKDITFLQNVSDGKVYDKKGYLLVTDLEAYMVKAYRNSKDIEAEGQYDSLKKTPLMTYIAIAKKDGSKKRKFAYLKADRLKYYHNRETTELNGHIYVKEKELSLWADRMNIDHNKETADLQGDITAKRQDIDLTCQKLIYDSGKEQLMARDGLSVDIKGTSPALVRAEEIVLFNDTEKDVLLNGNVNAAQGKKIAVADNASYNKARKSLLLRNNVKTVLEKGKVILNEGTVEKLKNREARTLLEKKTLLNSDELLISTENGDAMARGNVFVYQKGNEAKSDSAVYSEKNESIELTGNVYMIKEGKWVKAEQVNVSVKDETFEAVGGVEAKFKLEVN